MQSNQHYPVAATEVIRSLIVIPRYGNRSAAIGSSLIGGNAVYDRTHLSVVQCKIDHTDADGTSAGNHYLIHLLILVIRPSVLHFSVT